MSWWVGAVGVFVILVAAYVTWIAARARRLHARAAAAAAALDAQLVRRAAAAAAWADVLEAQGVPEATTVRAAAYATLDAAPEDREAVENALTRRLRAVPAVFDDPVFAEVVTAGRRVGVARQVHTDLVRDALRLRRRWLVRLFRLAAGLPPPRYFEIEDTVIEPPRAGVS